MDMQTIEGALKDIHYPINKQQLLQEAEQKGLAEAKPMLEKLPEKTFGSAEEVLQHLAGGNITKSLGL